MKERRGGNNYAAWAIAIGLLLNTAALSFWMGRLAQSVDNLNVAVSDLRENTPSKDAFEAVVDDVGKLEARIEKMEP